MASLLLKNYSLGEFYLEPDKCLLTRAGQPVHLAKRPLLVLNYLIENHERVVSRAELLEQFWGGRDVYDDALRKAVGAIRRALGDHSQQAQFIETRWASGYRYVGPLEEKFTNATETIEIEHTRGIKIVVEEEMIDSVPPAERPLPHTALELARRAKPQYFVRSLAFASAFIALVLIAVAVLAFRSRNSRNANQPAPPAPSLTVLPLRNLTGDANNEYLSDGLTDSLINELSRVRNLKVTSRASAFMFKGKEVDPRSVGQQLGVTHILEGTVSKSGERIRVNLRLVSADDGRIIWTGDSFDRALGDIFVVQDELSCSVAENLRVVLCGEHPHQRYTENVDAYQAYLKGRYHWNKRTGEGIKRSIEFYEQAIRLDANYALAYAGLADSYVQGFWRVPFTPDFALPRAIEAAKKAIEIDDNLAEAHTALASAYQLNWNWEGTDRELKRAIELNPKYARAHHVNAFHLSWLGQWDEALASIRRAQELDPLNLVISADTAMIMWNGRFIDKNRVDLAHDQCLKTIEMDANYVEVQEYLALIYWLKGMPRQFAEQYLKARELGGAKPEIIAAYRQAYQAKGVNGIFQKELDDMLAVRAKGTYQSPARIAQFYGLLGDKESAFKWLEKTFQEHNPEIVGLKAYPLYDPLRDDPRFTDLLRRVGLQEHRQ